MLAGVHYPSDNLASWYIDLKLAPICFGDQGAEAKAFMVDAIRQSRVHIKLTKIVATDPGSVYAAPMAWLEASM